MLNCNLRQTRIATSELGECSICKLGKFMPCSYAPVGRSYNRSSSTDRMTAGPCQGEPHLDFLELFYTDRAIVREIETELLGQHN